MAPAQRDHVTARGDARRSDTWRAVRRSARVARARPPTTHRAHQARGEPPHRAHQARGAGRRLPDLRDRAHTQEVREGDLPHPGDRGPLPGSAHEPPEARRARGPCPSRRDALRRRHQDPHRRGAAPQLSPVASRWRRARSAGQHHRVRRSRCHLPRPRRDLHLSRPHDEDPNLGRSGSRLRSHGDQRASREDVHYEPSIRVEPRTEQPSWSRPSSRSSWSRRGDRRRAWLKRPQSSSPWLRRDRRRSTRR